MEFKTPTIEDKEEIDRCILADDTRSCDYATANIILWSPFYQVKYAIIDGLFVSHTDEEGGIETHENPNDLCRKNQRNIFKRTDRSLHKDHP